MTDESAMKVLVFQYTSHRGITETRYVQPLSVWYGESEFHPGGSRWMMRAYDLDRRAERDFLLAGMSDITEEEPG